MADKQSREVDQFKYNEGDPEEVYTGHKPKSVGDLTVKVNVDVSEALTGLKAVQREAREATKALRELEEAQNRSRVFTNIPTHIKFEDESKSITDDITRSYGLERGVGE